jgi:D-alanyl-D-alanine carboxypeptidase/D-alanyl-D-alanine-endopeptidase (penicillin-binding protein 4)
VLLFSPKVYEKRHIWHYSFEEFDSMHIRSLSVLFFFIVLSYRINAQVQRLAADPDLDGALISAVLVDAITGEVLESHNEGVHACPASVWKLLTTAAALSELGPEFRFSTTLAYTGEIRGGTLHGDLLVMGSGDPTLGSRHFDTDFDRVMSDWVNAVRAASIDSIAGDVIGNGAHLRGQALPRTRIWEDMGNYYGTGIYGLNINDNTYYVSFSTPAEPGLPAEILKIYPEVPDLTLRSEVTSSTLQADRAYIFGSPLDEERMVRGTLPLGRERFVIKGSLPDPALFAAFHLRERLKNDGIHVSGDYRAEPLRHREPATYRSLLETLSPPLQRISAHVNLESDNLMAEGLLLQLGSRAGDPSIEGGLEALRSYLEGVWGQNRSFFAYDGSGLSRFNAVSAKQVADVLVQCNRSETLRKHLIDKLPLAGKDGTAKWFGRHSNLANNARLKSGSMENVRAYAGIFTSYTGRELIFAVMINNFSISGPEVREKIQDWLIRAYGRY